MQQTNISMNMNTYWFSYKKTYWNKQTYQYEPIIVFLEDYSQDHFKEEEDIMKKTNYIGYSLHKAEHQKFKHLISDLRKLYDNNKPTAHLVFFIRKIIDQLVTHIKTIDNSIKDL